MRTRIRFHNEFYNASLGIWVRSVTPHETSGIARLFRPKIGVDVPNYTERRVIKVTTTEEVIK